MNINLFTPVSQSISNLHQVKSFVKGDDVSAGQSVDMASKPEVETPSFAQIAAKYDVENISPRQVDQLVDELHAQSGEMNGDLLMLATHGADFIYHMSQAMGHPLNPDVLDQPVNLLDRMNTQLDIARRRGDPTESIQDQIRFLKYIQAAGNGAEQEHVAPISDESLALLLKVQENT